ncbi:hypothetical protein MAPG_09772 [Magnaporthiopsis poae ATCC 64411]|uniref:Uncharacterized protein n=1 Tax=Magnaporthiopsis poae (strain ATCC 64411 / 73-15) TaxID=644358 RepID=A0A0C4EAU1_MAGP6|nr:hypothetical protein MAPG_09772 [Magnaporthiopsis poae ATCC 64411]
MDSMVVQLDASEPSGSWRRIMHDGDVATGIVATATARLSQTLAQGLLERRQQKALASTLKVKSSEVDGTIPLSLGVEQREVSQGNDDSPLRYPPTTTASEFEYGVKPSTTAAASVVSAGSAVGQPSTMSTGSLTPPGLTMAAGASTKSYEKELGCVSPGHIKCLVTKTAPARITSPPRASLKRARPLSDVDGPYTSNQGCKKRRLLRHLVTSRLSRRFSIPATHVPNLESTMSMTGGGGMEKRFLRLAAVAAARRVAASPILGAAAQPQLRQQPHNTPPSEVLRRAAIMNRFRRRAFVQAAERGDDAAVMEMAASAALLRFAPGVNAAVGGPGLARFPRSSASGSSQAGILIPPPPPRPSLPISTSLQSTARMALFLNNTDDPTQVSTPTPAAASSRGCSPCQARQSVAPPTPGLALPSAIVAAGPLSRVAAIARRRSIPPSMTPPGSPSKGLRPADASPRMIATGAGHLPPISPRLRPLASFDDEEGVAFPTSEHESRYESGDESDDVYSDFSLMFGGGGGDGAEDDDGRSGGDVDGYEDFMDDLDGIPWSAR